MLSLFLCLLPWCFVTLSLSRFFLSFFFCFFRPVFCFQRYWDRHAHGQEQTSWTSDAVHPECKFGSSRLPCPPLSCGRTSLKKKKKGKKKTRRQKLRCSCNTEPHASHNLSLFYDLILSLFPSLRSR
ncbi:hypothetical protein F4861DRAFT_320870 [Xylaria intraflava]|nr:hypothetical protein F4861DRAFT_320870 [Xylaria intraflava]